MKRQPPEYALGEKLFEKRVWSGYWWKWRRQKEKLGKSRDKEKRAWLEYIIIRNEINDNEIETLYDALFN